MSDSAFAGLREREAMRDAARRFLMRAWPAADAVARGLSGEARRKVWLAIAGQGWLQLGADRELGGMSAATVLLEELGRASCPVPLLDAVIANVLLTKDGAPLPAAEELLAGLHAGEARVSLVPDASGGDAAPGAIHMEGGRLSGRAAFIESAEDASHFLVCTARPGEVVLVAADAGPVTVVPTPGLARPALAEIAFAHAAGIAVQVGAESRRSVCALARLGLTARALGAATRGFEMIVEYAKLRTQFGQPIGRYQAIQHKLANCLMALEAVRLSVVRAASAFDSGKPDWQYASAVAFAFASPALRQVCLETHHAFGGVSFWEEHEMPRHFRRIHSDLTRYGGVHGAREEIARTLLVPAA